MRGGPPRFLRGDANDDATLNIADAVSILGCKFLGDPCPLCRDAMDSNDDGSVDVSDAVNVLNFLFLGGPPPPSPAPDGRCGFDRTEDELPECVYTSCSAGDWD